MIWLITSLDKTKQNILTEVENFWCYQVKYSREIENLAQNKLDRDLHLPTLNNQQIETLQELGIKIDDTPETEDNKTWKIISELSRRM